MIKGNLLYKEHAIQKSPHPPFFKGGKGGFLEIWGDDHDGGKKGEWMKSAVLGLVLVVIPSMAWADWVDVLKKFKPRISLQEDYSSNIDLTSQNTREDFITTVSPGLGFRATESREAKFGLDLDYNLGLVFYARNSQLNYVSQGELKHVPETFWIERKAL
jgi:hypothetical protein